MGEFKPINTQEEFDEAIKSRLERERATVQKQYSDYEDLKQQVTSLGELGKQKDASIADLQSKLTASDTEVKQLKKKSLQTSIAMELGLPFEMSARLTGETEEEIRKDAESVKNLFKANGRQGLPMA